IGETIKEIDETAEVVELSNPATTEEIQEVAAKAQHFDAVIVGTLTVQKGDAQTKLVEALGNTGVPVIVVATRSPYDLAFLPDVQAYICTYEFPNPALKMAAKAIYGLEKVTGKLPVTIPK
ncbi:glycoside hydrolase family 3 C-terminal domain-containing protein, partial [Paenibacillus phytohabitans]|uniref:glycoside hydrolase family 3 C-terminal domain-containing protein n=1 Tax=Paenibacillus phytohabitans TaxID=2654978 RepID=UPI00300B44B7